MSAIGAIWQRSGAPLDFADVARISNALRFYGPEAERTGVEDSFGFAYAHRTNTPQNRNADQPVSAADGRYRLLFDGRLDNRADLARLLAIPAPALSTLSDADLAARCWEAWGTDGLNHWVGEFALIVWDRRERRLFAVRDQFGRRPLHYWTERGRVVIASMPRGIHAASGIERVIDRSKIAELLCGIYLRSDRSCFEGVWSVMPGHFVTFGVEGEASRKYYDLEDHIPSARYVRDDDYVDAARELMDQAVAATMRSDGPVGGFMSGGLDSTTGAVFASRHLPPGQDRLPVFTAVPEAGWDGRHEGHVFPDEGEYARSVAAMHPVLDLTIVDAAGRGIFDSLEAHLAAMEAPTGNVLNMIWIDEILAIARSRGLRTMIDGSLGNAGLSNVGGDAPTELLRTGRLRAFAREFPGMGGVRNLRAAKAAVQLTARQLQHAIPLKLRMALQLSSKHERLPIQARLLHSDLRREICQGPRLRDLLGPDLALMSGSHGDQWRLMLKRHIFAGSGNTALGWEAIHGIEIRDPFADRRLLEWCLGIPHTQYRRSGESRWLLKRLMQDDLPQEVLYKRHNTGRQSADWHLRLTRDLARIREEVRSWEGNGYLSTLLDLDHLQDYLEDWPTGTVVDHSDHRIAIPLQVPAAIMVARFVGSVTGESSPG